MSQNRWSLLLLAALPVWVLLAPGLADAQEVPKEDWEGKTIRTIYKSGFVQHRWSGFQYKLHMREGKPLTARQKDQDLKKLWETNLFDHVSIDVEIAKEDTTKIDVTVTVQEYDFVTAVEIEGAQEIAVDKLETDLRVTAGTHLNPAALREDAVKIRDQYLQKGYHFSTVEHSVLPTEAGDGVIVTWKITEGPRVTVASIKFTGNTGINGGELRRILISQRDTWVLGLFKLTSHPFVLKNLEQDLERAKYYYYTRGWLDIYSRDRIYLSKIRFNRDKSLAFINIHVEEGSRYRVTSVEFEGNTVFSDDELFEDVRMKSGEFYDGETIDFDVERLQNKYGEKSHINAQIASTPIYSLKGTDIKLVYKITEGNPEKLGSLNFLGNEKTRDDVLRREFTRRNFIPGEDYNQTAFQRALQSIRDRQWVDLRTPGGGLRTRRDPGLVPGTQDVTIDVYEGRTGNIRFAGGYSSSYGVLGMIELTERNFDLARLPRFFYTGESPNGGGQIFRIRAVPSRTRQSYSLEFVEPYFFGHELQYSMRTSRVTVARESWDEERMGATVGFDKRWDPITAGLSFEIFELNYTDLEFDAPAIVRDLEGRNLSLTLTPAIVFDTRDSVMIPSSGVRVALSMEYAGQVMSGDFDYNKYLFDSDFYYPVVELDNGWKHVFGLEFTAGWVHPTRQKLSIPISERFFMGGRGSIRGFDFRGIGPRENGDPVGGEATLFASAEYVVPLFTDALRGAVFYDIGTLESDVRDIPDSRFRQSVGTGIRFIIPQLGSIPVALDFGWALTSEDEDDERRITFDIGRLF